MVPFGANARDGSISCDGLVPEAALDLSHWSGNHTPERYRRDTSTESALAYADDPADDALRRVTNNHFDTDGLLSVFALIQPEHARRHRALLIAAAEAGDFEEWPSDERGLWLQAAVESLRRRADNDTEAYALALPALPEILDKLEQREELWRDKFDELVAAHRRATSGALEVVVEGAITLFIHRAGEPELPGPVLSRLGPDKCCRWLLAFERGDGTYHYRYERRRWAWADTVVRPRIAPPSRNACSRELGPGWTLKGDLGMTGLCRTAEPITLEPREVLARVLRCDPAFGCGKS
jgi:hypothetical protein